MLNEKVKSPPDRTTKNQNYYQVFIKTKRFRPQSSKTNFLRPYLQYIYIIKNLKATNCTIFVTFPHTNPIKNLQI